MRTQLLGLPLKQAEAILSEEGVHPVSYTHLYAATYSEAGPMELRVTLRSETSGVRTWRLYLDGNFKSEATAVLQ